VRQQGGLEGIGIAQLERNGAETLRAETTMAEQEQALMSDEEIMQAMMGDKVATPAAGTAETGAQGHPNLDFILDIPLDVAVELGRARMQIAELLQLGQGSVIELNKLAGEPMEILVNQKLIARGEVVVVNEKFGIRLTDIISPIDRVKQLGG
jgi:flagellar motor switch protein FliN